MRTHPALYFVVAALLAAASPEGVEPPGDRGPQHTKNAAVTESAGGLTLEQAVSRALQMNPSIAAGALAVSSAEARRLQAGLLPNPEFELALENFRGSGTFDGFDATESTAIISQPILLGGKRDRRRAVAESKRTLAVRQLEAARLDVTARTTAAFYRVVAAQQRQALARELLDVAGRFEETVQARVDAGKVSPVEGTRASIEASQARIALARANRELDAARTLLAATWNSSMSDFGRAVGALPAPEEPAPLAELRKHLPAAPEMTRLDDVVKRQERVVELEKAFRVPDLTVSLGPRRFEATGESAWVAGISMPIPVFDRNQGARRAAELDLERARREAGAARVGIEARLSATLDRLRAVALEVRTLEQEIVPAAHAALTAVETGYRAGKLGLLDVLDAQRTLFESRAQLLSSLEEYATRRTGLERLVGRSGPAFGGAPAHDRNSSQGDDR